MADRKRKRKSTAARPKPAAGAGQAPARNGTAPRNGSARRNGSPPAGGAGGRDAMKRGYAKAEVKNQAAREALEPLREGERPGVVIATAAWCLVLAANMTYNAIFADVPTGGRIGNVLLIVLVLVAIVGTLRLRYWAILGVQTILALAFVFAVLAALVLPTGSLGKVLLIPLVLLGAAISGYLFLRMIKIMARVQKTALRDQGAATPR